MGELRKRSEGAAGMPPKFMSAKVGKMWEERMPPPPPKRRKRDEDEVLLDFRGTTEQMAKLVAARVDKSASSSSFNVSSSAPKEAPVAISGPMTRLQLSLARYRRPMVLSESA